MSRSVGQVTTRGALLGGLVIVVAAAAVVAGAEALLRPVDRLPALESPAEPAAEVVCPPPRETRPLPRPAPPAAPVGVSSGELIDCPGAYDGRTVIYEGEVVRAVLRRGERAWVQLNDDVYGLRIGPLPAHRATMGGNSGMPVSIPADDADRITYVGDARAQGDRLRVEGTFHRADPSDAGGPTIQADHVEVTAPGQPVHQPITPPRVVVALLLAATALGMVRTARRATGRAAGY